MTRTISPIIILEVIHIIKHRQISKYGRPFQPWSHDAYLVAGGTMFGGVRLETGWDGAISRNREETNTKIPTYIMKRFLDLTNFHLDLCNFYDDDGAILILQSHHLGNKKASQPMNFHYLTILGMSIFCSNRNMMPKELMFLDEASFLIFIP